MGIKCPRCHHENPDDTLFCGKCGTKLIAEINPTKTLNSKNTDKLIADKYRVIEELGRGGMGIVFRAKDLKLDRTVALKFLPPGVSSDKEAKAASKFDHGNICTIYEISETEDERMFIAMPFYEGDSLKDRISQNPLEMETAISIITQIAEGLAAAHKKGIVHRDIKPANIMITKEGVAKILDFGIAKLGAEIGLTQTGSTVGTTAYMSPEQAQGEKVDSRSDIWSLGVVLHEMLTGQLPFKADTMQGMIYSILNKDPEAVSSIRPDVPGHVERVLRRSLEKDKAKRYQSMEDFKQDLNASLSITSPKTESSIVVLPFENLSPDPDQEYFSDGLTEEIITDLSQIHSLCVISRNSAMAFKKTKKDTKTIGRELNVQYALEGSVRKAGNNLRITAQLIDAETDSHIWANKYAGTLDDVFDIQETVSRSIVEALKLKLSPEENRRMSERPIDSIPAYELYLKAQSEIFKFNEEAIARAIRYIKNALNIIGDNALLYSGLAFAHWNLVNIGAKHEDYLEKAEEHVKKALAIDPDFPKAHVVLAWIHCIGAPLKSAYHANKALEKTPDDSMALAVLAVDYMGMGKMEAAASLCGRLIQIDPLDFPPHYSKGALYFYSGQYDKALEAWRKLYEMYPESAYSKWSYALILTCNNRNEKAFSIIDQSARNDPDNVLTKLGLMLKYGLQGKKAEAIQEMNTDFKKTCRRVWSYSHHMAGVFALLDEREEALIWLESAVNLGLTNYPLLNELDPFLDNIRSEPRFKKLMERVKTKWENTDADA